MRPSTTETHTAHFSARSGDLVEKTLQRRLVTATT
jgi:hypothetical protein